MRSQFGTPLTVRARELNRVVGVPVRPRARQTYTQVTPSWGPKRTQMEMDMHIARPLQLGIPDGGVPWRAFGADPGNKGPGGNAASDAPALPSVAAPTSGGKDPTLDELSKYAPLAVSLLQQLMEDDPRTDYRVYQAKVKNLKETIRTLPPFLQPFFRQRLRIVQARLQAAKERRKLEVESEEATRTWRWFGWSASGIGIAAGIALGVLLLAGATAVRRNPYDWRNEESRKAVVRALQTRDPEDVARARRLQVRAEEHRSAFEFDRAMRGTRPSEARLPNRGKRRRA